MTYTGDEIVFTAPGGSSASVQLRATVSDSSALSLGDIRNATITFKEGTTVLCGPLPAQLLGTNPLIGTASCSTTLGVGSHVIDIYVGDGYYTGVSSALVEVAQPDGSFITGAGKTTPVTSGGTYAATNGSPIQFGFNIKYLKNQKTLQGHFNSTFVSNGRTYQISSTSLQSLGILLETPAGEACSGPPSSSCFGLANIASKATLTDITNPIKPTLVASNQTLDVTLTDKGNPGSSDSIGITLWNGNTLVFSSEWTGSKTIQDLLGGGNLVSRV